MRQQKTLVTISHYNQRSKHNLNSLLLSLKSHKFNLYLVINDDNCAKEKKKVFQNTKTLIRPNIGMNIGSWNSSYLNNRNFDFYIFVQDECKILNFDFVKNYVSELSKNDVGITGESINYKWANKWENIANSSLNYIVGYNALKRPVYRVQYYLSLMKKWGIEPGLTGLHLRSLVWGFKREVLEKLFPFPLGNTKEECIASEIAVSKKVEQLGLKVTQVHEKPFKYISHFEWKLDGSSKVEQ